VRYRARVEYDGTDFAGFQLQPRGRTVQGELEQALGRVSGERAIRVEAAGRTDAGVHATGQVIAFTYRGRLTTAELSRALDALLPADVAVHGLRRVAPGFRPRYAARFREYRYSIWNGPRSPLRERYALGVRVPLDGAAMARAARELVGRHDFSAFGGADRQPVRTVHSIRVRTSGRRETGRTISIDVTGDAFLRQMVRSIAAGLIRVGRGEAAAGELAAALKGTGRAFAGEVAPAKGLCLRRVVMAREPRRKPEPDTR
jgi:tRNA pseudouridine38-40 synthase